MSRPRALGVWLGVVAAIGALRLQRVVKEWGLFPAPPDPDDVWTYETVARQGTMWSLRFRFASQPLEKVRFERAGRTLSAVGSGEVRQIGTRLRVHRDPSLFPPAAKAPALREATAAVEPRRSRLNQALAPGQTGSVRNRPRLVRLPIIVIYGNTR